MTILAIRNEKGREISAFSRTFSFDVLLRKYKTFFFVIFRIEKYFCSGDNIFFVPAMKSEEFQAEATELRTIMVEYAIEYKL